MDEGRLTAAWHGDLRSAAADCMGECDPARKVEKTRVAVRLFERGILATDANAPAAASAPPGRPAGLRLVSPLDVPKRKIRDDEGRAAFVHAIAHIEWNAINLAWDCVQRFPEMPRAFYTDWVAVAGDEAEHYRLLEGRLARLGYRYGDFEAHDGLWEMAEKTADDLAARMAMVPRVLEARGLDVAPGMIDRLERAGDPETAAIVRKILDEEVAHVAAGTRWFRYVCEREGNDPEAAFAALLDRFATGPLKGPLNVGARIKAGFTRRELDGLAARRSTAKSAVSRPKTEAARPETTRTRRRPQR